ncbi:MAG: very short patch repair endonuclease [Acidimicrobiales bacterium]
MQRQRRADTRPEVTLRHELHRRGLSYRLHLPVVDPMRRHDIVFPKAKVVIEVRGCFWHRCPQHATSPRANAAWWAEKLDTNKRRDEDTAWRLADAGWTLVVVWEHEDPIAAATRIEALVRRSVGPSIGTRTPASAF